jgi:hypothetical protein
MTSISHAIIKTSSNDKNIGELLLPHTDPVGPVRERDTLGLLVDVAVLILQIVPSTPVEDIANYPAGHDERR